MFNEGILDHGGMLGLTDDDHTQYFHTDGTDSMTGDLPLGANKLKFSTTLLKEYASNVIAVRNLADNDYRDLRMRHCIFYGNFYMSAPGLTSYYVYGTGMRFRGDDGVEMARVVGTSGATEFIISRAGDITMLANKEIKNVGIIKVPNIPVADPADGTSTLWNNAGVVTVGT